MRIKHKYLTMDAYISVEAAIVVPITLFIVVGMLYVMFYLHDVPKIRCCAYDVAIESEFEQVDLHEISKKKRGNVISFALTNSSIWTMNSDNNVKYKEELMVPFRIIKSLLAENKIDIEKRAEKRMDVDILYGIKVAKEFLNKKK